MWDKKARDYYFKNRDKLLPLKRKWMRKFRAKNKEFGEISERMRLSEEHETTRLLSPTAVSTLK